MTPAIMVYVCCWMLSTALLPYIEEHEEQVTNCSSPVGTLAVCFTVFVGPPTFNASTVKKHKWFTFTMTEVYINNMEMWC